MAQNFDDIVAEVTDTLGKVAGVAILGAIASEYIKYLLREAKRFGRPEQALDGAKLEELAALSRQARREVQREHWEEALARVHALLASLPGDPTSLPPKAPRPPWKKK